MLNKAGSEIKCRCEILSLPRSNSIPENDASSPSECVRSPFRQTDSGAFRVEIMLPVIALLRCFRIIIPVKYFHLFIHSFIDFLRVRIQ